MKFKISSLSKDISGIWTVKIILENNLTIKKYEYYIPHKHIIEQAIGLAGKKQYNKAINILKKNDIGK